MLLLPSLPLGEGTHSRNVILKTHKVVLNENLFVFDVKKKASNNEVTDVRGSVFK